jgi:hypothetical protein
VEDAGGLELQEQPPVTGLGQHRLERQRRTSVVPIDRAVRVQVSECEVGVVEGGQVCVGVEVGLQVVTGRPSLETVAVSVCSAPAMI